MLDQKKKKKGILLKSGSRVQKQISIDRMYTLKMICCAFLMIN